MLYRTGTRAQAEHDLFIINLVAASHWQEAGYTVIDTENGMAVIGKNAMTGENNPHAFTTTWAEIEELPDGRFGFVDPSSDPRFLNWKERLPEGQALQCVEENYIPVPALEEI